MSNATAACIFLNIHQSRVRHVDMHYPCNTNPLTVSILTFWSNGNLSDTRTEAITASASSEVHTHCKTDAKKNLKQTYFDKLGSAMRFRFNKCYKYSI